MRERSKSSFGPTWLDAHIDHASDEERVRDWGMPSHEGNVAVQRVVDEMGPNARGHALAEHRVRVVQRVVEQAYPEVNDTVVGDELFMWFAR